MLSGIGRAWRGAAGTSASTRCCPKGALIGKNRPGMAPLVIRCELVWPGILSLARTTRHGNRSQHFFRKRLPPSFGMFFVILIYHGNGLPVFNVVKAVNEPLHGVLFCLCVRIVTRSVQ